MIEFDIGKCLIVLCVLCQVQFKIFENNIAKKIWLQWYETSSKSDLFCLAWEANKSFASCTCTRRLKIMRLRMRMERRLRMERRFTCKLSISLLLLASPSNSLRLNIAPAILKSCSLATLVGREWLSQDPAKSLFSEKVKNAWRAKNGVKVGSSVVTGFVCPAERWISKNFYFLSTVWRWKKLSLCSKLMSTTSFTQTLSLWENADNGTKITQELSY